MGELVPQDKGQAIIAPPGIPVTAFQNLLGEDDGTIGDGDGQGHVHRVARRDEQAWHHSRPFASGIKEALKDLMSALYPVIIGGRDFPILCNPVGHAFLWIGISVRPGPVGQLGLEDVSPS